MIEGVDVLIDLLCLGVCVVFLFFFGFIFIVVFVRFNWQMVCVGCLFVVGVVYLVNVLCIVFFLVGIVQMFDIIGVDVMVQFWYDLIGLISIVVVLLIVLLWVV